MTTVRNTQLDGWRAFAVMGVMWLHWAPREWRGPIPFEIGLFFFLTLTGFLITRILLRERSAGESNGTTWRTKTYLHFQKRRMLRILVPCYAAMIFALLVGATDIRENWFAYFGHWSNFHMAGMEHWPSGTAHYWTLALQMQFYLVWPFLIFLTPQRLMTGVLLLCVMLGPLSRFVLHQRYPQIHHSEAITTSALDYFGVGALLALALHRGMQVGDKRIGFAAKIAFVCYTILYVCNELDRQIPGFCYLQQTFVAVVFAGLISATLKGFSGILGQTLDHPAVQHIGRLSFGLYLFHTPVPLLLGKILPWLWLPFFNGPWLALRLLAFTLTSWGIAWLSWRYLEKASFLTHGKNARDA